MERRWLDLRLGMIFVFCNWVALSAFGAESVYSKIEIAPECEETYRRAVDIYNQSVTDGLSSAAQRTLFNRHSQESNKICRMAFAAGLFDAQNLFHQTIVLEYGVELWHHLRLGRKTHLLNQVKSEYAQRFAKAGLDQSLATVLDEQSAFFQNQIPAFIKQMQALAREQSGAVRFGRFVFVQDHRIPPQTLFEPKRDDRGQLIETHDGVIEVTSGSYQRLAENVWHRMLHNAEEYCQWMPSVFFGQDSFWHGALRRVVNPEEPSVRVTKEKGYFNRAKNLLDFARRLNLKLDSFQAIYAQMIAKQRSVLERDLKVYRNTERALYAAPLIPAGMMLGASGLAYAGLQALPAGTASFTVAGGSFLSAANIAALTSASVMAGFAGSGIYEVIQAAAEGPITWAQTMDRVVGVTVQSFPLAALAPAFVGGTGAGVKYLSMSVPAFVQSGMSFTRSLKALGIRGAFKATPQYSWQGAKWWFQTWWNNKRVLGFNFAGNMVTAVGFEVYSREFVLGGNYRMIPRSADGTIEWFNWSDYNKHSLVTLGGYAVSGVLFQPALKMRSIVARSIYAQTLTIASVAVSSAMVQGKADLDRVYFETEYSLMYARWRSEALRPIYLSKFVTGHSAFRQTALTILMNVVLGVLEAPVKNYLLDEYMEGGQSPVNKFRQVSLDYVLVDVSDFSDDEIELAWQTFFEDPANQDLLANLPSDLHSVQ